MCNMREVLDSDLYRKVILCCVVSSCAGAGAVSVKLVLSKLGGWIKCVYV